ncbi:hypothetical protein DW322_15675 [Rhodococcus rhodnii]|uniref:Uncharacterized protein n=1 Tax=Rhodococcus rhodnii TaxID=38312 RepID=A0A6P2CF49_9NOCA|nr:hypothetical protein DW322_15675 [Rhodococcus rhodnii]
MSRRVVIGVVALLALVVGVGIATPSTRTHVAMSDSLGPDGRAQVDDYLSTARDGLDAADGTRWALVSFTEQIDVPTLAAVTEAADVRVAQVLFRAQLDRVQMPVVTLSVAAGEDALLRAPALAQGRAQGMVASSDRASAALAYTSAELGENCRCVLTAVVRGEADALRALAAEPVVRAVEVAPADAVAGRFAVRPLEPEQTRTIAPGPDDGPIPAVGP